MKEKERIEFSVVMPCLNEEKTLARCIEKARSFFRNSQIEAEIIIADNGSTDGSREIASEGADKVVFVEKKGYGCALRGGIDAAEGRFIIMGDADDSYDFSDLNGFVTSLRDDYELVMGNRFSGGIRPGAMPFLHRYVGNPVLSFIGRLLFDSRIRDFHCGLRGFSRDAYHRMNPVTDGMEFASEIVVKAVRHRLRIKEVPVALYPDGRERKPHLRTWRDGFRHLKWMLLMYFKRNDKK